LSEILDPRGHAIVNTNTFQSVPSAQPVRLVVYLGRQYVPGLILGDERANHETVRYGLRLLPIAAVDLGPEDARLIEESVQGSAVLIIEANERERTRERPRWFIGGGPPLMVGIVKPAPVPESSQEVT